MLKNRNPCQRQLSRKYKPTNTEFKRKDCDMNTRILELSVSGTVLRETRFPSLHPQI